MEIPASVEPRIIGDRPLMIPRIIHQTFETADVPDGMHTASQSWIQQNPTFAYRFHDREARRQFLSDHFPPAVGMAYDKLDNGAFRADLWRYCVLSIEGGVYADIDSVAKKPLEALINPEDGFVVARAGALEFALFNGFICVTPDHPFMAAAVERATRLILDAGSEPLDGFMVTGPGNLGAAANLVIGRDEKTPFTHGPQSIGPGAWRIIEKSRDDGGIPYVADGGEIYLYTDYEGYRADLAAKNIQHWQDQRRSSQRKPHPLRRFIKRSAKRLLGRL